MTTTTMAGHKGQPYYDIFLNYDLWLETVSKDKVLDGEGFALLLEIEKTGSLTASARNLEHELPQGMGHTARCGTASRLSSC